MNPCSSEDSPQSFSSSWYKERRMSKLFIVIVSAAIFTGLFAFALTASRDDCPLTYTHNSVISEAVLRKEAARAGWPLTHPKCNVCPDATHVPVWIAPGDLCRVRPELQSSWQFCKGTYEDTEFSAREHVKVCMHRSQLVTMWETGLCHSSASPPRISGSR